MKSLRLLAIVFLASSFSLAIPLDEKKEPFWKRVLRIVGISATPSAQKGPGDEVSSGEVWLADIAKGSRSRITYDGGYRSPIFLSAGDSILALRGNDAVLIAPATGKAKKVATVIGAVKLVGVSLDDGDKVLILSEDGNRPSVGILSLATGNVTPLPHDDQSKEDRVMLAQLRGSDRYYGDARVYLKRSSKLELGGAIEWTDVYLKLKDAEPRNLSNCEAVNCGQPSFSQSGKYVLFIKATS